MLPATIQTWTYTGRCSVERLSVPTEAEHSVTSCALVNVSPPVMHIYTIPPTSRMNRRQKRVPKLFCSDFIRVFSLTVETTFSGNHNRLPNFLSSNTVLNIKLKQDQCNQAGIWSVYTWMENIPCSAFGCRGLGMENVLVDFGNQCFNRYTIFSNSFFFFYKIHDSCHNFLIMYAKQSTCSCLLD